MEPKLTIGQKIAFWIFALGLVGNAIFILLGLYGEAYRSIFMPKISLRCDSNHGSIEINGRGEYHLITTMENTTCYEK